MANWGFWGVGGANFFFFRGRNVHQGIKRDKLKRTNRTKLAVFRRCLLSENSSRLWPSEIPCWKGFSVNFDTAGI